jgi:aryl-alcohol dehydrogenase-like predicted oxidoreductase
MTEIEDVTLGASGPRVSRIALGAMGMSGGYGAVDEAEAVATLHAAIDAGITMIDTGDYYGAGHNEALIGGALRPGDRENIRLSVKFGALRTPGGGWNGVDSRPAAVKNFLTYSLQRLGVDHVDIYRPGRLDPDVPIEETVGAIAELIEAGYVRHVGLSEVGSATLRRAAAVHDISDLQIEYSLMSRGIESDILPAARELGIAITAYGVLSRGLLSDTVTSPENLRDGDSRNFQPRFQSENLSRNLDLVQRMREFASERGMTVAQAAIAWVLRQGQDIVPVVGIRTRERLAETLGTLDHPLTEDDCATLGQIIDPSSVAGERLPAPMLAMLDSE